VSKNCLILKLQHIAPGVLCPGSHIYLLSELKSVILPWHSLDGL